MDLGPGVQKGVNFEEKVIKKTFTSSHSFTFFTKRRHSFLLDRLLL